MPKSERFPFVSHLTLKESAIIERLRERATDAELSNFRAWTPDSPLRRLLPNVTPQRVRQYMLRNPRE